MKRRIYFFFISFFSVFSVSFFSIFVPLMLFMPVSGLVIVVSGAGGGGGGGGVAGAVAGGAVVVSVVAFCEFFEHEDMPPINAAKAPSTMSLRSLMAIYLLV